MDPEQLIGSSQPERGSWTTVKAPRPGVLRVSVSGFQGLGFQGLGIWSKHLGRLGLGVFRVFGFRVSGFGVILSAERPKTLF